MRYAVFIMMVFALAYSGKAQTKGQTHFAKAKIYLQEHKILTARNLTIIGEEASFLDSSIKKQQTLLVDDIDFIKIPKGNHALIGGSFGAATGALSALLIDLDTDPLGRPRDKDAGFYLAMTGGGAVLGALIGFLVPKWKSIFLNKNSVGLLLPIEFDFTSQLGVATVKISMKI